MGPKYPADDSDEEEGEDEEIVAGAKNAVRGVFGGGA